MEPSAPSAEPQSPQALSLAELGGRFLQEALGFGIGGAISPAIAPLTQELANQAWQTLPVLPLSPADLANMVVQGVKEQPAATSEAAESGISAERFAELVRVNGAPIAPEQALDLWNRGEIKEADVDRALVQSRLKPEWVTTYKLLRRQLVQIADLANMVVQSILPLDEGRRRAQLLGLDAADFEKLTRLAGNPPGPETLLDMWNRGYIDEAQTTLGLRQSRLKPEWIEHFKKNRHQPASTAAAVAAVIKERIPMARGVAIAAMNGTDEQTFKMLVDEGGRPMGTGQALTLVRRGQMTVAEFAEVVARSDVKTEYTEHLLQLRTVYPSLYQVKQMIATGALADADAKEILKKEGYTDTVIAAIVAAGHGIKLAGSKQLTAAATIDLYKQRELTKAQATELLEGLGYDANDAGLLLGLADYQAGKSYRDAVIAVVKARFLQRDIDVTQASSLLDSIGMPAAARDEYLQLWNFDVQANPTLLTLAQLNLLVKQAIWTREQYIAYLPRHGYQQPEIEALAALYAKG